MTHYVQPDPEIKGWMSPCELEWLFQQARQRKTIVEVGCWFGRSTHALLSGCTGIVYAVDHFKGSLSELDTEHRFARDGGDVMSNFMRSTSEFMEKLVILPTSSVEAAETFRDASLDMVFLDGDHTKDQVLADLTAWRPKVKPGGLLCGHDRNLMGVPDALMQFFGFMPPTAVHTIWSVEV